MTTGKKQNTIFLFGAGISAPAKIPSISDITSAVLSGEGWSRASSCSYYHGRPQFSHINGKDEDVPRVVGFLNRLKIEIDSYYSDEEGRAINYEDLFYAAEQIHDSELREFDNPVVQPFIDKIMPDLRDFLEPKWGLIKENWQLSRLADEAMNFIIDIVSHYLSKNPLSLDYLRFIEQANKDRDFDKLDIFTLNHDTILEQYLGQFDINFIDGFTEEINEIRYWNPELLRSCTHKIRLIKLHGSLSWFRITIWVDKMGYPLIGIPPRGRSSRDLKGPNGERADTVDGRPLILAGTFNKMLEYTKGIYADLHYEFYQTLRHTTQIVICGYSFRDKAINTNLIEWMGLSPDNRIILIHPDIHSLTAMARPAINRRIEPWIKHGKLIHIPKRIENISWEELKQNMLKK